MLNKRILAILTIWLVPVAALAANEVTVDANTTLVLPDDSSSYTMSNGSQYDSMTVNSTSFDFVLSQGGRVTLTSGSRKKFAHNAANPAKAELTCGSTESTIVLSLDPPFTTTTVTVTPSGTCDSGSGGGGGGGGSSGGGGGGGGGGGSYTPAPTAQAVDKVAQLKEQIAATQAKIAEKIGAAKGVPHAYGVFARDLAPGLRDEEVKRLQELLATDKEIYPEGNASGFYGSLTQAAVRRFQLKHGVIKKATDPGNGRVGPATRKKLVEIFGSKAPSTPAPKTEAPKAPAATEAKPAAAGLQAVQDQIKALQAKLLQAQIKAIQEKINSLKK